MARPNLSYLKNVILFLLGIPCGLTTALTGMDGTSFWGLTFGFLLGRRIHVGAVALSLTFFAAFASLLAYHLHHDLRWVLAAVLAVGQLAGAGIGQRLIRAVPFLSRLHSIWAILVVCGGLAMMGQALGRPAHALPLMLTGYGAGDHSHGIAFFGIALGAALLAGVLSPIFDLRRVLIVPAEIYLLHLSLPVALGTGSIVLLLTALPVLLVYRRSGHLEAQATTWLSVGGFFGGLAGAYLATQRLTPTILLAILGIALSILGAAMLWRRDTAPLKERQSL